MTISERDGKVAACIEHRAREPLKAWSKLTGIREHTLRYTIATLEERGVVLNITPFIDMYPLGLVDYTVYFSVASGKKELREALLSALARSRLVSWLAEIGGDYQYGVSISVPHVSEAALLMHGLSAKFGNIISDKLVTIRLSFTAFGRKYLCPALPAGPVLEYGTRHGKVELVEVDAVDRRILGAAANLHFNSLRDLARLVQIPSTTLERRIRVLEEKKVIRGYIYRFNIRALGMQRFKLLVFSRGINASLSQKLYQFSRKHPQVINFSECLGPWDYELTIEVPHNRDVAEASRTISDTFAEEITGIRSIAVFGSRKFTGYPDYAALPKRLESDG